jgi:hypothetical protein
MKTRIFRKTHGLAMIQRSGQIIFREGGKLFEWAQISLSPSVFLKRQNPYKCGS